MTAPYPDTTYVAHRLFTGRPFPDGGVWGDILDGPVPDAEGALEAIIENFKDEIAIGDHPSRQTLRVWHIEAGRAEDCTGWAIEAIIDLLTERDAA
ncbi:MAG: hypothetical protein LCH92_08310 [Proteobacteria bacterium]|nr:hypothetical protein [Pseudomonadota bacterium]